MAGKEPTVIPADFPSGRRGIAGGEWNYSAWKEPGFRAPSHRAWAPSAAAVASDMATPKVDVVVVG